MTGEKKAYPLRVNTTVLDAMQRWSEDEPRSPNAQIEYVLCEALVRGGRLKPAARPKGIGEGSS
ncbi:MAG: Arc family DNA binding domain-containing protein [Dokdonella sp.]